MVQAGGVWAPRPGHGRMHREAHAHAGRRAPQRPRLRPPAELAREREVFRHAATGLSNKEMADRLDISRATVKAHLTQIFQKLGVSGRAQLAAVYHGLAVLVDPPRRR